MADREVNVVPRRGFTVVNNYIFDDKRLDFRTRGVLLTMLRLPKDWDYTIAGLATLTPDGKAAVRTAIKKLEELRYIRREQLRGEDGSFQGSRYTVYDEPYDSPLSDFRTSGERTSGNPTSENPTSENRTEINNNKPNTKEPIPPISPHNREDRCGGPVSALRETADAISRGNQFPLEEPPPASGGVKTRAQKLSFPHDSEAYRCAVFLDERIRERLPQKRAADEATLQRWAADFEKCHRLDGYDWRIIGDTLAFSQRDGFWQMNILSGRKFRGKMVQLMAKAAGGARDAPGAFGHAPPERYIPEVSDKW